MLILTGEVEDAFFAVDRIPVQLMKLAQMPGKNPLTELFRRESAIRPERFHDLLSPPPLPEKQEPHGAEAPQFDQGKDHRRKKQHDVRQHETGRNPVQNFRDGVHDCVESFLVL